MNDQKIDLLIQDFQSIKPTEAQLLQWSVKTLLEKREKRGRKKWMIGIAASLLIGILMGHSLLQYSQSNPIDDLNNSLARVDVYNLNGGQ